LSVLIHDGAYKHTFTVHKDIISRRSEYFRLLIEGELSGPEEKPGTEPVELKYCNPEVFDNYLHCVYHNEVRKVSIWPQAAREGLGMQSPGAAYQYRIDSKFEDLFGIYDVAFRLDDPITSNLVIREMQSFCGPCSQPPGPKVIELVFRKTDPDDRLRNLLVDFYLYGVAWMSHDDGFSPEFLALFMERFLTARANGFVEVEKSHLMRLKNPGGNAVWNKDEYCKQVFEDKEPQRYEEDSE
jgi:hypothetical protein